MSGLAGASIPSPDALSADRPCLNCGYNLRGLDPAGLCPECGTPVERSLRGNLLQFSSPEYLALLHRGTFLVQAAIIMQVLSFISHFLGLAFISSMSLAPGEEKKAIFNLQLALNSVNTATSLGSMLGWWLLSAPDPAFLGANDGTPGRKTIRVAVVARAAATLLAFVGSADPRALLRGASMTPQATITVLAWLVSGIAWIVMYFAAMRYLQWLAPRLPNIKVRDRAKLLTWLGPLLYVFGCGIGQLVALVMYYNLLEWVRKDLKSIRAGGPGTFAATSA